MTKIYKPIFSYKAMDIYTEKSNNNISRKDIKNIIMKDGFKALDFKILEIIYQFKYITKAHIEKLVSKNPIFKKDNIKKRLAKLSKYGLLTRQYFTWNEDIEIDGTITKQTRRSPYFYSLSKAGIDFYCKSNRFNFNIKKDLPNYDTIQILNKMTVNQVIVNYIEKVSSKIEYQIDINTYFKDLEKDITIHGIVTLKTEDKDISFLLIPVRKNPNWYKEIQENFSNLKTYIIASLKKQNKKFFKNPPICIFICEDDLHMRDTFKYLHTLKGYSDILSLFTTDIRQLNQDLSNSLNSFKVNESGQFELIEFNTELLM